jgi:hypothetical protein
MAPAGAVANTGNLVTASQAPNLPGIISRRYARYDVAYVIRIGHSNQLGKMRIQGRDLDAHAQRRKIGNEAAEGSRHAAP